MGGYLIKRALGGANSWKRRYVVLYHDIIAYFLDDEADKIKGFVLIRYNSVIEECGHDAAPERKRFCFKVATPGQRTLFAAGENEADMNSWLAEISTQIKALREIHFLSTTINAFQGAAARNKIDAAKAAKAAAKVARAPARGENVQLGEAQSSSSSSSSESEADYSGMTKLAIVRAKTERIARREKRRTEKEARKRKEVAVPSKIPPESTSNALVEDIDSVNVSNVTLAVLEDSIGDIVPLEKAAAQAALEAGSLQVMDEVTN